MVNQLILLGRSGSGRRIFAYRAETRVRNQTITKADQSHTGGKNLSKMAAIQHPHAFASVAAENIYITNALPNNDNILFK